MSEPLFSDNSKDKSILGLHHIWCKWLEWYFNSLGGNWNCFRNFTKNCVWQKQ